MLVGGQAPLSSIPQFYYPAQSSPSPEALREEFLQRVDKHYEGRGAMAQKEFVKMMQEVGGVAVCAAAGGT